MYAELLSTAWIGGYEFFIRLRHLNQGLMGYQYFDFRQYPGKDRLISFGVKLMFTD